MNDYMFPKKNELYKIGIEEVDASLPDLKNTDESKAVVIGNWLGVWIRESLKSGKLNLRTGLVLVSEPFKMRCVILKI